MGGSLTALAPDFNRAVLGVPGMNYSTLLRRSVDFDQYAQSCSTQNYPNELERPLILSLIQMLWDRGEANGYAHHMTGDPLPNTPPHEVLLHEAFGDHQVANVATEVEARTIGAALRTPALDPGRHTRREPVLRDPADRRLPVSTARRWSSGTAARRRRRRTTRRRARAPTRTATRATRAIARAQKSEFLKIGGRVVDTCGAGPCYANGYTGAMSASRRWAIALATLVRSPPPWQPAARASHQPAELISTGPAGGNGPLTAAYAGSSDRRRRACSSRPSSAWWRPTPTTAPTSTRARAASPRWSPPGRPAATGAWTRSSTARPTTGRRVLFGTSERLTRRRHRLRDRRVRALGRRDDAASRPARPAETEPQGAFFDGVSADGARVFFHTAERLDRGRHRLAGGRVRALRRHDDAGLDRVDGRQRRLPGVLRRRLGGRDARVLRHRRARWRAATRTPYRTCMSAPAATRP